MNPGDEPFFNPTKSSPPSCAPSLSLSGSIHQPNLSLSSSSSSPLMEFEGFSVGRGEIASPLMEFEAFSAMNQPSMSMSVVMTESKGSSLSSSPRSMSETGDQGFVGQSTGVPQPLECLQGIPIPPFLSKTYDLVEDPSLDRVISWGSTRGESFVVWDTVEFSRTVLPQNFKHNNFSSFVRQLNTYGFRKVDTDRWEFANEDFICGKRHLLKNIHRRKSTQAQQIGSHVGFSGEIEKSGVRSEIERLRTDKNLLMQEVVQLQQEHRLTAHHVEAMNQLLESAEQRQKQTVSFLAKVLQNPVFLSRLQQRKEQKEITSPRVKRKFVKQHHDQSRSDALTEGQLVKYKPDFSSFPTSLTVHDLETVADEELSDPLLSDMVGKLGLGASSMQFQFRNVASDELQQEHVGTSNQICAGTSSMGSLGSEDTLFEGKTVLSPQPEVGTDYISFPEELMKEKNFPELMSPSFESIIKQEDIWGMGFDASAGISSSSQDVWGNIIDYDPQVLAVTGGLLDIWDLGSQQTVGGSGTDKWPGDESAFDDLEGQAGHSKDVFF